MKVFFQIYNAPRYQIREQKKVLSKRSSGSVPDIRTPVSAFGEMIPKLPEHSLVHSVRDGVGETDQLCRGLQDAQYHRRVTRCLCDAVSNTRNPENNVSDRIAVHQKHLLDAAFGAP